MLFIELTPDHRGARRAGANAFGEAEGAGGQDVLSSRAENPRRKTNNSIVNAVKGVGATWVRQIDRTYDVTQMRDTLREALTTKEEGPKIIVASSECMLNKQRRTKPLFAKAVKDGRRMVKERFGVDEDVCTGQLDGVNPIFSKASIREVGRFLSRNGFMVVSSR